MTDMIFQISSVAAQQKGMQANVKLAGAMGTATKTMVNMNKIMRPEDVAKNMKDFEQASAKLDMTDELSKSPIIDCNTLNFESVFDHSFNENESSHIIISYLSILHPVSTYAILANFFFCIFKLIVYISILFSE